MYKTNKMTLVTLREERVFVKGGTPTAGTPAVHQFKPKKFHTSQEDGMTTKQQRAARVKRLNELSYDELIRVAAFMAFLVDDAKPSGLNGDQWLAFHQAGR